MTAAVRLTVLTGPHRNHRYCFCGPTRCLAGRSLDCFVQLSGTERDRPISRHHCRFDIDPPNMHIEDLGSMNGTYVNGKKVEINLDPRVEPAARGIEVQHGDLITLGGTTLRVDFMECPHAHEDGTPIWGAGETAKRDCGFKC